MDPCKQPAHILQTLRYIFKKSATSNLQSNLANLSSTPSSSLPSDASLFEQACCLECDFLCCRVVLLFFISSVASLMLVINGGGWTSKLDIIELASHLSPCYCQTTSCSLASNRIFRLLCQQFQRFEQWWTRTAFHTKSKLWWKWSKFWWKTNY